MPSTPIQVLGAYADRRGSQRDRPLERRAALGIEDGQAGGIGQPHDRRTDRPNAPTRTAALDTGARVSSSVT